MAKTAAAAEKEVVRWLFYGFSQKIALTKHFKNLFTCMFLTYRKSCCTVIRLRGNLSKRNTFCLRGIVYREMSAPMCYNVLQIYDGRVPQHKCSFEELNFRLPQNCLRSTNTAYFKCAVRGSDFFVIYGHVVLKYSLYHSISWWSSLVVSIWCLLSIFEYKISREARSL